MPASKNLCFSKQDPYLSRVKRPFRRPAVALFPLVILLAFSSCTTREPVQIIDDYEIVFTSGKHIRYSYHRLPENDTIVDDYSTSVEDNVKYVTEVSTVRDQRQSMRKFQVTADGKQLVQIIYYSLDSTTNTATAYPGEVIESSKSGDGEEYVGGKFVTSSKTLAGFVVRQKNVEKLVGEESYLFNGQQVPSLRFENNFENRIYNRYFPFFWTSTLYKGHVIFSKGIGVTYFRVESDDGIIEHRLVDWELVD